MLYSIIENTPTRAKIIVIRMFPVTIKVLLPKFLTGKREKAEPTKLVTPISALPTFGVTPLPDFYMADRIELEYHMIALIPESCKNRPNIIQNQVLIQ